MTVLLLVALLSFVHGALIRAVAGYGPSQWQFWALLAPLMGMAGLT